MVRQLAAGKSDLQHTLDILAFARSIFHAPIKAKIEKLISNSSMVETSSTNPLRNAIQYSDEDCFAAAGFFYMWRNAVCGIVQRILGVVEPNLSRQYFDPTVVVMEDKETATKIAMSTEYAFQETPNPPFAAMRICTPMLLYYGAWDRLHNVPMRMRALSAMLRT